MDTTNSHLELPLFKAVTGRDVNLRDVVLPVWSSNLAYTVSTVIDKRNQQIKLFRPFVHTSDFEYTGGVIPYIGIEEYWVPDDSIFYVLKRS